mgnify:CR=1 FL=1
MSLKPDRNELEFDLSRYMNSVATRGGVAVMLQHGSGVAMDGSGNIVEYATNPSGKIVAGLVLQNVVSLGTHERKNPYKDETLVNGKVALLTKGWVVTDMVYPGTSPAAGAVAYLGQSGYITPTSYAGAVTAGRFETSKDEDGFVKFSINIP